MGWLYNILVGEDVFVIKTQCQSTFVNGVGGTDVFWFDSKEHIWQVSPLNQFRPPKETHN